MRSNLIREQCGLTEDLVTKIEKAILIWFGHMERPDDILTKGILYRRDVTGRVNKGCPELNFN